jgi:hypothetical protein
MARLFKLILFFTQILRIVRLPNLQFLYALGDSFDEQDVLDMIEVPLFVISTSQSGPSLFPNIEWLNHWALIKKMLCRKSKRVPWELRTEKLFWRGATTGTGYREKENSRWKAVEMGEAFPEEIEASFSYITQISNLPEGFSYRKATILSPWNQINYKYFLAMDGNSFPSSFQWQLSSESLIFKQQSPYLEWYYAGLEPFTHYIPVKQDLSDLLLMKRWAQKEDETAKKIAKNAKDFANKHLTTEGIIQYVAILIKKYGSLLQLICR